MYIYASYYFLMLSYAIFFENTTPILVRITLIHEKFKRGYCKEEIIVFLCLTDIISSGSNAELNSR